MTQIHELNDSVLQGEAHLVAPLLHALGITKQQFMEARKTRLSREACLDVLMHNPQIFRDKVAPVGAASSRPAVPATVDEIVATAKAFQEKGGCHWTSQIKEPQVRRSLVLAIDREFDSSADVYVGMGVTKDQYRHSRLCDLDLESLSMAGTR